ncbi:DNA-directed RNA polymerase III RPC4 family protein [Striga asiatica]|uniref:DNA-directed RNA polymerase III RPC4 family protein n=1 Tax=Striga asiatica TaxID=4170 RepID=A0A5A7RKA9_STRAF|nr:DNA-directed RNA polymerase III RPC4 family protein [Striga asiatica]
MDPDLQANTTKNPPRKVKFAPKRPPKREPKPIPTKVEKAENDIDAAKAEQLLRRFNEASLRDQKPKVERKVGPTQVSFGFGGSSSSTLKSYGVPKAINNKQGSSSEGECGFEQQREYKEPWDYYTYYPVTLPLRRPYAGNPGMSPQQLDEEEFGEDSLASAYDENVTKPAEELGLLDEDTEDSMLFFQLPSSMPMLNKPAYDEVKGPENNGKPVKGKAPSRNPCSLESLPAGHMGKMLVYKSGAVKLKLGETLYDVSSGLNCVFAQDVVAVNTDEKQCCNFGELKRRAVITPDIDIILDSMAEL